VQIKANSPEEYIAQLPEDRKQAITELRKQILDNLPEGFEEQMNYGNDRLGGTSFNLSSRISYG